MFRLFTFFRQFYNNNTKWITSTNLVKITTRNDPTYEKLTTDSVEEGRHYLQPTFKVMYEFTKNLTNLWFSQEFKKQSFNK